MGFISPVATDANGVQRDTGSMQTLGKDDFLKLMITKLQYQDPLSPMEDSDFIAQLAQFSTLEQMNNIAEGIATSNKWDFLQMQSLNNVMASGLIGREVTADFSGMYLDTTGDPNISFTLVKPAAEIEFTIRDESGTVIATISARGLDVGSGSIKWDGTDTMGNRAPEGYYLITATASTSDGAVFTPDLKLVGIVSTITYRDGTAFVQIDGTEVSLGDIRSVGQPSEDEI